MGYSAWRIFVGVFRLGYFVQGISLGHFIFGTFACLLRLAMFARKFATPRGGSRYVEGFFLFLALWLYGFIVLWFCGFRSLWFYGFMVLLFDGCMVVWLYGFMDVWRFGFRV